MGFDEVVQEMRVGQRGAPKDKGSRRRNLPAPALTASPMSGSESDIDKGRASGKHAPHVILTKVRILSATAELTCRRTADGSRIKSGMTVKGTTPPPQRSPLMFLFFSNKLGCLASLGISLVLSLIVLALLGFLG